MDQFRGAMDVGFVSMALNGIGTLGLMSPAGSADHKREAGSYGSVHVSDRLTQHRPLQAGETFVVRSAASESVETPKGTLSTTPYTVVDSGGEVAVEVERNGLNLKPAPPSADSAAAKPPSADPKEGREFISSVTFTPDMVAGYCYFATNRIHNELDVAQKFGYRLPIWAGTQGFHLTLAHLYSFGNPATLTALFELKRPVFWTDTLELWFGQAEGETVGVGDYALVNQETGKLCMSMTVEAVSYV